MIKTIIIGAGNVAGHIAPALEATGKVKIAQVWSHTAAHAAELAAQLSGAEAITDLKDVDTTAHLYIISVIDDALPGVVASLPKLPNAIVAHTSGSVGAEILAPLSPCYGVFYPLQTFSRAVAVDVSEAPFFIEASTPEALAELLELARAVSKRVYEASSELRRKMHIAAVFACNFANHLWAIADDILHREAGLTLDVLNPLLHETLRKALECGASEAQTGPARRGDTKLIEKHIASLPAHEAEIYKLLSRSILEKYE